MLLDWAFALDYGEDGAFDEVYQGAAQYVSDDVSRHLEDRATFRL